MSNFRRKLLMIAREIAKEKIILVRGYEPNGEKFYLLNAPFDIDSQTIFADITLENGRMALQCILDIGLGIQNWSGSDTYALHTYYPSILNGQTFRHEFNLGANTKADKMDTVLDDNHIRIAVSANGYYMNGVSVLTMRSNARYVFKQIMEKIRQEQRIEIGSQEGEGRSYAVYNEVSVYYRCMSVDELKKITEKREMS